jgi:hypothetical protein
LITEEYIRCWTDILQPILAQVSDQAKRGICCISAQVRAHTWLGVSGYSQRKWYFLIVNAVIPGWRKFRSVPPFIAHRVRFRFEAKLSETEAKFFLLRSETEGLFRLFRFEAEQ